MELYNDLKRMWPAILILVVIALAYFGYRYFSQSRSVIGTAKNGSVLYAKAPTSLPLKFVVDFKEKNIQYWENGKAVGGSYITQKSTKELFDSYKAVIESTKWKIGQEAASETGGSIYFYDPAHPEKFGQIEIMPKPSAFNTEVYFRLLK
jgi:hypothetical protein